MMIFLPTTKSILRIASLSIVLTFSTSRTFVTAFRSTGLSSPGTTVSLTNPRRRHPQLPTASSAFSLAVPSSSTSAVSSASTTTVLYRIRCENKYYQLEELEDADNCTTELFLKSNGVVDVLETDGPLFVKAVGEWNVSADDFVMSITKTYTTGHDGNDMGEFTFDVERVFQGEMMVVGGTDVAVNGKIYAEDYLTTKIDKEVGFFNMIDGTKVRLDQRPDAADFTPGNNILGLATVDVGGPPTNINSNDVVQHGGIPQEWGLTATELQQRAATATVAPPDGAGAATSSPYEDQLSQQYGQHEQEQQSPPLDAYGQQQQQPQQQPLPNTIDAYEQQQQQQYQYQQQQQQQQPTNPGYTAGADAGAGGSGGLPEYGGGNFGQDSQAYGGGGDSNPSSYQQYGNDVPGQGYDDQQQYQQQQYQQNSISTSHNNNDPGPPSFADYNTAPYGQEQHGQEEQQQPTAYNEGNGGTSYDSNNNNNNSDYDNTDPDDYYYNNGDDANANANNTDDDNRPQGGNEYTTRRSGGLNPMGFGGNNDAY